MIWHICGVPCFNLALCIDHYITSMDSVCVHACVYGERERERERERGRESEGGRKRERGEGGREGGRREREKVLWTLLINAGTLTSISWSLHHTFLKLLSYIHTCTCVQVLLNITGYSEQDIEIQTASYMQVLHQQYVFKRYFLSAVTSAVDHSVLLIAYGNPITNYQ